MQPMLFVVTVFVALGAAPFGFKGAGFPIPGKLFHGTDFGSAFFVAGKSALR
jgi:hypothetical protein